MSSDPYLDVIDEHWQHIALVFHRFRDKDQVIELDVEDRKIYSYPAADYIRDLSERMGGETARQFIEATASNRFLLFVKDSRNRRLRSYVLDVPERIID